MKLSKYLKDRQKLIDLRLKSIIPSNDCFPPRVHEAMHYCAGGGKRIRPILCLASCKLCGGNEKHAILAACAIEIIHTYSLVHDDLPCMDNADSRRGKPSCHKQFDEATAVLTGDGLMTLAYNVLAQATNSPSANTRIIKEISEATGTFGMIGGQVVDIQYTEHRTPDTELKMDLPTMEYINSHKTGALIAASCKIGAIIAKASKEQKESIFRYGEYIGFTFQIIDDILDNEGLARIFGRKEAQARAKALTNKAKKELSIFKKDKKPLTEIADFILKRKA